MTLLLLPEEVLEGIVKHLGVKDLLACSAVNSEWRDRFNVDKYWKHFCIREIKDYLEETPCEVEPSFSPPENCEEKLQPLCEWRVHYMRNVHLLNNWKSQKCSSFEFRKYDGVISCDVRIDCDKIHWLFLRSKTEIEIWKINTKPQFYTSVIIFPDCPCVNVYIAGKRAIFTQWNIVSVYDLNNNEGLQYLYRFVLEEDRLLPAMLYDSTDIREFNGINKDDDFRFATFGTLLVGYKRIPNPQVDLSVHIWDTILGTKIKIEWLLNHLGNDNEVAFTNIDKIDDVKGLIRIVYITSEHELFSQLYIYDFKKLTFTETNIMFAGVVVWCGCAQNIIVTFSSNRGGTFKFHNYSSGSLLSMKEVGEYTNSDQIQLINSFLLYCTFNCMNVFDILKQEVVYCLQFSFYSFVRRLNVIEPRFAVVWLLEHGTSPGCPSHYQEVWDMKDLSRKLLRCSSKLGLEMVTYCPSVVKQVVAVKGSLCLYTFW